ncbi:MAG: flagellar motor switch protein FliN [Hydrogenothermaceae bacterium]
MAEEEKLESEGPEDKINKEEELASQWASMIENQQQHGTESESHKPTKEEYQEVDPKVSQKLQLILDIPISITFEIGSRKMSIEEITKLSPSSVIELDRYIDQPIDIKVNGVLVAKGELYQVEDNFAVKITQILSREERLKLLTTIGV